MKISASVYLVLAIALAVMTFSPFQTMVLSDVYAAGTETEATETEGGEGKKKKEGEEEPDC